MAGVAFPIGADSSSAAVPFGWISSIGRVPLDFPYPVQYLLPSGVGPLRTRKERLKCQVEG